MTYCDSCIPRRWRESIQILTESSQTENIVTVNKRQCRSRHMLYFNFAHFFPGSRVLNYYVAATDDEE